MGAVETQGDLPAVGRRQKSGCQQHGSSGDAGQVTRCWLRAKERLSAVWKQWRRRATYELFGEGEKEGVSSMGSVEMQGDLRSVGRGGESGCQQHGSMETQGDLRPVGEKGVVSSTGAWRCRATYLLLGEGEKGVVSSVGAVEMQGDSPPVGSMGAVEMQGDLPAVGRRQNRGCQQHGSSGDAGQVTCCWARAKEWLSTAWEQWRRRVTYELLGEGKKAVVSSVGVVEMHNGLHSVGRRQKSGCEQCGPVEMQGGLPWQQWRRRATYKLLGVGKTVVFSSMGALETQGDLPAVGRGRKSGLQQRESSGDAGRPTSCWGRATKAVVSSAGAVEMQVTYPLLGEGEKAVVSSMGAVETQVLEGWRRGATYVLLGEGEKAVVSILRQWGCGAACWARAKQWSSAVLKQWRRRATYILLGKGKKAVISGIGAVETQGEKAVFSSMGAVEMQGDLRAGGGGQKKRLSAVREQWRCRAKKRLSAGWEQWRCRATYILLGEGQKAVVSSMGAVETQGDLRSVERGGNSGCQQCGSSGDAGGLTFCWARGKKRFSAVWEQWRRRATYELLGEGETAVVSSMGAVETPGNLRAVGRGPKRWLATYELLGDGEAVVVSSVEQWRCTAAYVLLGEGKKAVVSSVGAVKMQGDLPPVGRRQKSGCQQCGSSEDVGAKKRLSAVWEQSRCRAAYVLLGEGKTRLSAVREQ
ncbi:hypothetical protein B0H14DRAFT_3746452 [Mycena olivaceomarginata]|nr:hypothetical protein B0H14DRAFT_3746452 [Mycena olivaceomarginata]